MMRRKQSNVSQKGERYDDVAIEKPDGKLQ
jgi:hypothetical protein